MKGRLGQSLAKAKTYLVSPLLLAIVIIITSIFFAFSAYADDIDHTGGDTGGTTTNCDFPQMYTDLCGNEGGASWHIYKTDSSNGPADGSSYSCGTDSSGNSVPCVENSDSLSTIKSNCAGSGYYVAYGWDGRTNGSGSSYQHIGPTKWNSGVIADAKYNNSGGLDYDDIISQNFSNGDKLKKGVAESLHEDMGGGSTINNSTGYFCVTVGDKFEARATSTESINTHNYTTSGYTDSAVKGSDNKITIPCSNNGCDANFTFDIKRTTSGNENASWAIQKRSATKDSTGHWTWSNTTYFGTGPGGSGNRQKTVSSFNLTLDPGTTTCYRISFTPNSSSSDIQTVATCVEALPVTFEGYSRVYLTHNTSTRASTGWKNSGNLADNTAWLELTGCNDGCDITFEHGIKRTQGLDTSTSNYDVTSISANSGTFPVNSPTSHTVTIKTGQAYCRTLTFDRKIAYSTSAGSVTTTRTPTRACAYAIGTYSSSIDIKAKKSTSSTWLDTTSSNPIYAKPTDIINLQGNYTPKYQPTYSYKPYLIKIGATNIANNGVSTIQNAFNSKVSPSWNNAFSIKLGGNSAPFSELAKTNAIGNDSNYSSDRNYAIDTSDPGNTITATALTNNINTTKTTPKQIGFTYAIGSGFTATINNDPISDAAYIKVPYNFNNSTCIKSSNLDENDSSGCIKSSVERIAYAGETETINYLLKVNRRNNTTVGDNYATIVKNARWKLRICINENENCTETSAQSGNLNADGLLTGDVETKQKTINIPDVPAGTRVCLYSAIYPTSVVGDTDLNSYGNDTWGYSSPSCFKIAKKPSLQIVGGNIYSRNRISTETSVKKHLSGINDPYNPETTTYGNHVFGSWGELGLIASDRVTGLSSGATLSYPNGSSETSICNRSPLTFANSPCSSTQSVGQIGNSIAATSVQEDNDAISSKYLYGGDPTVAEDSVDLANEDGKMRDDSVYYYYATHDLTVPASVINKGKTKIIHSTGNITITGDLKYADSYTSFDDIPKLLIYAHNIAIGCDVSRVDAILAAEERVITCNNFDNDYDHISSKIKDHINDAANSQPLTINGAIIARQLIPNRTYGAATGSNSGIPAETINFDPTLYRWGGDRMEGQSVNTSLNVTYQHEQAPRY